MKVKYLRIAVSSFLAMVLLLIMAVPVFAIDDPDFLQINTVYAYRHCLETDDMLLLIDETIDYSITGEPTETATDAYLVRLINATTSAELASVAPYSYHNSGYDRGLVAIYFSAADLPALGWNPVAPGYTIQLTGNPLLDWDADPPFVNVGISQWSSSTGISATQVELSQDILGWAQTLETSWGAPADLVEAIATGSALTATGEAYFGNVVSNLRTMAPYAYSSIIQEPEWPDEDVPAPAYADGLVAALIGTPLDFTDVATSLGMSRAWFSTILFFIALLVFLYVIVKGTKSTKAIPLISGFLLLVAGLLGFVPAQLGIGMGVFALITFAFMLFYKPSSA